MLELVWTPDSIFITSYCLSALSGIGLMIHSGKEFTFKNVLGTVLVYGAAGSTMSMICYYRFGGKEYPWLAICVGQLVGIRIIKLQDIAALVRRLFNVEEKDAKKDS